MATWEKAIIKNTRGRGKTFSSFLVYSRTQVCPMATDNGAKYSSFFLRSLFLFVFPFPATACSVAVFIHFHLLFHVVHVSVNILYTRFSLVIDSLLDSSIFKFLLYSGEKKHTRFEKIISRSNTIFFSLGVI